METLKNTADSFLKKLTDCGADAAQVSVVKGLLEEFNVDSGEFSLIRSVYSSSASAKAIKDNKRGNVTVNDLSEEGLSAAAKECLNLAQNGKPDEDFTIASLTQNKDFVSGTLACDKEKFFDNIIRFTKQVEEEFPLIMLESISATYGYGKSVLKNTNGVCYTEEDGNYSISVMFSAHDGDNTGSFNYFDFDFYAPDTDIMSLGDARGMFERAIEELNVIESGEKFCGTAIIMPQCLGDFIGIIEGFTSDFPLIEKTSPWKDKLGQRVANECFTLNVIPHDDRIIGGENITSDGYISENYTLIGNGILKNYSLHEYGARKTGFDRAPSTSGAVEILPGEKSLDEIIASIENGILVGRFSGGEPGANGDFSGVAKNSFLIKNGKITGALKETMISGNMTEMLMNINAISKETVNDTSTILPWIAFDGITVS